MKSLCLLWFMKTKATVRNLFKKPSSAIFTIFIVLLYGFVFYSFLFLPKDQSYMAVNFELHSSILLFVGFLALMLFDLKYRKLKTLLLCTKRKKECEESQIWIKNTQFY